MEEEAEEEEVLFVEAILYRSAFRTRGIALVHTFIFHPLPDFTAMLNLGRLGSTQYVIPNIYGIINEPNTLLHWSEAFYVSLKRKRTQLLTGIGVLLFGRVLPKLLYCGAWSLPSLVLVTPAFLFFKLFGWLASFSMFFFYSFSNCLYFTSYLISLWALFSGWSVIPLSVTIMALFRRDWLIYDAMPDEDELWLRKWRACIFFLISRKGSLMHQLFKAYRKLAAEVSLTKVKKKRWKRSYLFWFDNKLVSEKQCCKCMYDELYRALKLTPAFVQTSQSAPNSWFDWGSRWKSNGYTYQFVSSLCASLPFGWGFYLSPIAGQFIQDLLLFTIKYVYIATDPRAVKNIALACEFLQFRNSPLGITLHATAGEWLGDYLKDAMEDLEKLIQQGFDKLDESMGLSWEERCRANGVPVGGPLGQSRTNRYTKRRWRGDLEQRGILEERYRRDISDQEENYNFVPTSFEVSVEGLIKMLNGFEGVLRSQVTKRILQVLAVLVAIFSFSKSGNFTAEGMSRVINAMKSQQFDESVDMLSYFVSILKWLAETGWHLFRFPSSTLSPENSLVWKEKAEKLLLVEKCAGFSECTGAGILTVDGKLLPLTQLRSDVLFLIKIEWPTVEAALKITSSKFIMSEFKTLKNRLVIFESVLAKKVLSQQYRFQPFGIALTGGTSVGKSNVSNTIFAYLSALDGLDHTPEMVFSRNPLTVFWDTFVSQRYILFDDVGAIHPQSKLPDTSLIDVLQVANNAPYVPPMAAADEKGTQCITSAALIATSNFMNLNAHVMFGCPAAIYRRFHVWTVMSVKPRFADHAGRLDPDRVRTFWLGVNENDPTLRFNRQFPPYWDFSIHATGDEIEDDPLVEFNDPESSLLDYLGYIRESYENHKKAQERVMQSHSSMKRLSLCSVCRMPKELCTPATGCTIHTALVRTMRPGRLEDEIEAEPVDVEREAPADQYVVDIYWSLVVSFLLALLFGFGYAVELISFAMIVKLLWCIIAQLFICVAVMHLSMTLIKAAFVGARDACSIWETMYLPYWFTSYLLSRLHSAGSDVFHYFYILAKGRFTRAAFVAACLGHANRKLKKTVTVKNGIIVLLIVALVALARQPAYRLLKSTFVLTMQSEEQRAEPRGDVTSSTISRESILKDFVLPGKSVTPAEQEDSRSAWYNPYPPMDTRTDSSRCLNGDSGMLFVESSLRRATCNLEFTRVDGSSSVVRGLAVGGNLILTCAHALYSYKDGLITDKAVRGAVVFPSMIEGRATKSEFQVLDSNSILNIEEDWALISVPTMTPRKSLVNLFVERSHSFPMTDITLRGGNQTKIMSGRAVLVSPLGLNWFDSWQKRVGGPGVKDLPPGYLETNTFFGRVMSPSSHGMSGSTLVSTTGGVSILGLQCMSDKGDFSLVLSTFIGRTQLKDAIRRLSEKSKLNQFADISREGIVGKNAEPPEMTSTPTRKNPLNFPGLEEYNFAFVATLRQVIGSPSSRFAHPPYREFFRSRGYISDKEKPVFDWKSKRNYLSQIAQISPNIDIAIVDEVSTVLTEHWIEAYGSELKILETLSLSDAINGNDYVTWVERLKMDTSAGFPWNVRKSELLEVRAVPESVRACGFEYSLTDDLLSEFQLYFLRLVQREPATYPYKGTQKDEPISPEKNSTRGPRLFCAANLYVILAGRMLFGSYIRLAQRNPFISWAAVGMNAASKVWGLLWLFISYFGKHRMIAGDYGNFDQNMSPIFTTAAYAVIIGLLKASGNYTDEEIRAAQSWAFEAIYPTVLIDGDIFSIAGTNPSGNPLTVHVNCVVNILYIMYIWVSVGKDSREFFIYIRMMTYGDDNIISVHDSVTGFDFWVIHIQLAKIGVKYTPADKSKPDEGRSFDSPEEVAFLKRLFVERDGFVYAPLDFSSICKTLNCWMTSLESDEAHGLATFVSIWENACHYEDDLCDRVHKDIIDYCTLVGWSTAYFVPKQSVRDRFRDAEINRFDVLLDQIYLVQTSLESEPPARCVHSARNPTEHSLYYASEVGFEKIFRDYCLHTYRRVRMMFQGLAFSINYQSDHVSRWFLAQDGSWLHYWNVRQGFGVPHGAGVVPLVENELRSDSEGSDSDDMEEAGGSYDGFFLVSGPDEDAQYLERPQGPV